MLVSNLKSFELYLWKDLALQKVKFLFLVSGWEGYLNGDLLAVAGGKYLSNTFLDQLATLPPELPQKVDFYSKIRSESANLKWNRIDIQYLTPCHFSCLDAQYPPETGGEPGLVYYLQIHFLELFTLYTADRATQESDTYHLTYAREGSEASLILPTLTEVLTKSFPQNLENTRALLALLDEVYDVKEPKLFSSRLALAQAVIGQTLRQKDTTSERYCLLLTKGETLKSEYDTDWANLWDDKVSTYLGKVKDLEELVNKTVSTFADQVTDLIKSLSDTALATVATIVGTLVASLLADKFKPIVFIAGVVGYGCYLIIIQGFFNLVSRRERFDNLRQEYEARKKPFVDLLREAKVKAIEGSRVTSCVTNFNDWYTRTWWVYGVVAAILVILIIVGVAMPIIYGGSLLEVGSPVTPTPTPSHIQSTPSTSAGATLIPLLTRTVPISPR